MLGSTLLGAGLGVGWPTSRLATLNRRQVAWQSTWVALPGGVSVLWGWARLRRTHDLLDSTRIAIPAAMVGIGAGLVGVGAAGGADCRLCNLTDQGPLIELKSPSL